MLNVEIFFFMLLSSCLPLHVVKCIKSVLCAGKKQQQNLQVFLLCSGNVSFVISVL